MRATGPPRWLWLPAGSIIAFLTLPLAAVAVRLPWARLPDLLSQPGSLGALRLSLLTGAASTAACVLLGVPAAVVLGRARTRWADLLRTVLVVPMVLPPVVSGLALLAAFGRQGLLGRTLSAWGVEIGFTTIAVILAQTFVSAPYLIAAVDAALRTVGSGQETMAAVLGAGPTTVLRRVTLPVLAPAVGAGVGLCFARCLGEFGATLTFAGSLPGVTRTMPLEIYLQREVDTDAALAGHAAHRRGRRHGPGQWLAGPARGPPQPAMTNRPRSVLAAQVGSQPPAHPQLAEPTSAGLDRGGRAGAVAIDVDARVPERGVDLRVQVAPGETVAVVGGNGAGKTSLLQLVTGQLAPRSGTVTLRGRMVAGPGCWVPVHRRRVALLEQRPLLFEHLDVLDNVAFGPRYRGSSRRRARHMASEQLAAVEALDLAARRAWELSGGQAQRVALARALATEPDILLLDEPFAALDVRTADTMRRLLRARLHTTRPATLLVTHELVDALMLADTVAVVDGGRVVERDRLTARLDRPHTRFLADLAGVNLLAGTVVADDVLDVDGVRVVGTTVDGDRVDAGHPGFAAVPADAVGIDLVASGPGPRNVLPAVVETVEPHGAAVRVAVSLLGARAGTAPRVAAHLTPVVWARLGVGPGDTVQVV